MASVLNFDPDSYGTYARASATADYLELLLLNGHEKIFKSHVSDWIDDNGWARLFGPRFGALGTTLPVLDASEAADHVFDVLLQRSEVLQGHYPFDLDVDGIGSPRFVDESLPYIYLLGLVTAHAYSLGPFAQAPSVFEYSIERVLIGRTSSATAFRRHLGSDGFHAALVRAAAAIGSPCAPAGVGVSVSLRANDEGLDVLAEMPWNDTRLGRWTFVGQATVAKSDRWQKKSTEPSIEQWKDLLMNSLRPNGFFAVPHHIQEDQWEHLQYQERLLLDRLRLARWLGSVEADEWPFIEAAIDLDLEPLTA